MNTLEVLIAARAKVEAGWTQGVFRIGRGPNTCYCPVGAMGPWYVDERTPQEKKAIKVFAKAVGVKTEEEIYWWNDALVRTKEDVLAAFDKAIEKAS